MLFLMFSFIGMPGGVDDYDLMTKSELTKSGLTLEKVSNPGSFFIS